MKRFHSTKPLERMVWAVIAVLCLLIVWYMAATGSENGFFPDPVVVFRHLLRSFSEPIGPMTIPGHVLYSLSRVAVGVVAGSIAGSVLGLFMGLNEDINAFVSPLFHVIRPIPTVAWIPLSIMWFGLGRARNIF